MDVDQRHCFSQLTCKSSPIAFTHPANSMTAIIDQCRLCNGLVLIKTGFPERLLTPSVIKPQSRELCVLLSAVSCIDIGAALFRSYLSGKCEKEKKRYLAINDIILAVFSDIFLLFENATQLSQVLCRWTRVASNCSSCKDVIV